MSERSVILNKIVTASACVLGTAILTVTSSAFAETTLDFVTLNGNISESNYNSMITNYCKIPLNVRENLQLAGWNIIMTSEKLEEIYPEFKDMTICALTDPFEDSIWLEDTRNGANAIIHEVGHYIAVSSDETISWDATSEWLEIWEEEKKNISNYAGTNASEGFAEAFKLCILKPETFEKKCPKSCMYITSIYESLEGVTHHIEEE